MTTARSGERRCPACAGVLAPFDAVDLAGATAPSNRAAELLLCTTCHGVWFDWWAGETASLARRLPDLPRSAHAPLRGLGHCPDDGSLLVDHAYLDKGPLVRRCQRCLGIFAHRAQIDELARFAEHLPEHPGPIEDASVLTRLWRLLS